eukprot:3822217-Rhodomonas_salina.1
MTAIITTVTHQASSLPPPPLAHTASCPLFLRHPHMRLAALGCTDCDSVGSSYATSASLECGAVRARAAKCGAECGGRVECGGQCGADLECVVQTEDLFFDEEPEFVDGQVSPQTAPSP